MSQEHAPALKPYLLVFVALILLTGLTVSTAHMPIGSFHAPVALAIALTKAVLVILIFMHALHKTRLTFLILAAALFMLTLLMALTFADYLYR